MFGYEIETHVPVDIAIDALDLHPTILRSTEPDSFKVDLDRIRERWVLEFVTSPLPDHDVPSAGCLTRFKDQFDLVYAVIEVFAKAAEDAALKDLATGQSLVVEPGEYAKVIKQATIGGPSAEMATAAERAAGSVHYTAGIALEVFVEFLRDTLLRRGDRQAQIRAEQAIEVAASAASGAPAAHRPALEGFVALYYLHFAGVLDADAPGAGQGKNRTLALCRVPWFRVNQTRPPEQRTWLRDNRRVISLACMAAWKAKPFGREANTLPPDDPDGVTKLRALAAGAFSAVRDDPIDAWGDMTVVNDPEPVGPAAGQLQGYALELRHYTPRLYREALWEQTIDLVRESRRLHNTDGTKLPPPRARSNSGQALTTPAPRAVPGPVQAPVANAQPGLTRPRRHSSDDR